MKALLAGLLGFYSMLAGANEAHYIISPKKIETGYAIAIEGHIHSDAEVITLMTPVIEGGVSFNLDGPFREVRQIPNGIQIIQDDDKAPLRIRYLLSSPDVHDSPMRPYINERYMMLLPEMALYSPPHDWDISVHFENVGDWDVYGDFSTKKHSELIHHVFLAGSFQKHCYSEEDCIIWDAPLAFPEDEVEALHQNIDMLREAQNDFWASRDQMLPQATYLIESPINAYQGALLNIGPVVLMDKNKYQKNKPALMHILSHELMHQWLGYRYLKGYSSDPLVQILYEGLTDYYALKLATDSGVITADFAQDNLDRMIAYFKAREEEGFSLPMTPYEQSTMEQEQMPVMHMLIRKWLAEGMASPEALDTFTKTLPEGYVNTWELKNLVETGLGQAAWKSMAYYFISHPRFWNVESMPTFAESTY